jgi:tetratricopeptide (TPR) repeat protein
MTIDFTTREGRQQQGKLIQQAAEEAGVSLEGLARAIGCSRALIYQYVSGATLAQPDRIQAIARETGKSLVYFYGGTAADTPGVERLGHLQALLSAQLGPADLDGALATTERLTALAHQVGDGRLEAATRLKRASVLLQQGDAARALVVLDALIVSPGASGQGALLRTAEHNRGHALFALGRIAEAAECFARALAQGDWAARWQGLVALAAVAEYRGAYADALAHLDEAVALIERAPDARAAQTLRLYVAGNLANVYLACGDSGAARTHAEDAHALAIDLANRDQYLEALLTRGVCQRLAGDLVGSRQTLEEAARWARLSGDGGREALAWAEGARTLVEIGRLEEARVLSKDALQKAIATSTRRAELTAQLTLAVGYLRGGLIQEARYHAAQALEISQQLAHPWAHAQALIVQGAVHAAFGDLESARHTLTDAQQRAESIGARALAVEAGAGLVHLDAPVDLDALLAEAREVASPLLTWTVLLARATRQEREGTVAAAEETFRDAIAHLDTLRDGVHADPHGDTILEYRLAWEPYLGLARLLAGRGAVEAATAVLQRAEWPPLALLAREGA